MKRKWLSVAAGYLLLLLLVGAVLLFGRVETVDEHYAAHSGPISGEAGTVILSVDCLALEGETDRLPSSLRDELPEDLIYLPATEFPYREGMTAFDLLLDAERPARLRIVYSGIAGNYYVSSINDLAEFSAGNESGWTVLVSGVFIDRSASSYKLSPGDRVEWRYTVFDGDVRSPELLSE